MHKPFYLLDPEVCPASSIYAATWRGQISKHGALLPTKQSCRDKEAGHRLPNKPRVGETAALCQHAAVPMHAASLCSVAIQRLIQAKLAKA